MAVSLHQKQPLPRTIIGAKTETLNKVTGCLNLQPYQESYYNPLTVPYNLDVVV